MKIVYISYAPQLTQIIKTHDQVILDFYSEWCSPCKALDVTLKQIKNTTTNYPNLVVCKIDAENPELETLSTEYGIKFLPTMIYLFHNEKIHETTGAITTEELSNLLEKYYFKK